MHVLKQEFEVLLARLDCLTTLIEGGSTGAAEALIPAIKIQAEKTSKVLDDAIHDFRLFDDFGDVDADQTPINVRMEVDPHSELGEEEEEEEDDEDEEEDGEGLAVNVNMETGEMSLPEEDEDEYEEDDEDEGDDNSNTKT